MDDYSQVAIKNINIVLHLIKLRLDRCNSKYDSYTTDQLVEFANQSLTKLNSIPAFTNLTWEYTPALEYNDLAEFAALFVMNDILETKIGLQKKAILQHSPERRRC
jgi:hypothetical protein